MTKSIKQLRSDLNNLSLEVDNLAEQLKDAYEQYLPNFIDAVGRQLIMASYQLCTQKYPESFLSLSYSQRVKLQENLKNLANLFQQQLGKYLSKIEAENQLIYSKFYALFSQLNNQEIIENNEQKDSTETEVNNIDNNIDESEYLSPEILLRFGANIEGCLEETLNELSVLANNYLQEAGILPPQIPAKILEMALQSEESSAITNAPPNLLSLLIEKENINSKDEKNITPITAICLRISEIEFTETNLSNYRSKIRNIFNKIEEIIEIYLRKKRDYTVASAESAWRSSWYEENK